MSPAAHAAAGAEPALHDAVADCLRPIAADAPCGHDARTHPSHEAVRAEIEKLASLRGELPDWARVAALGRALLAHESKDLRIAAYVGWALVEREGVRGLGSGCALLCGLLDAFGDQLFPRRARARAQALAWFAERARSCVGATAPSDPVERASLRAALERLRDACARALGVDAPELSALLRWAEVDRTAAAPATSETRRDVPSDAPGSAHRADAEPSAAARSEGPPRDAAPSDASHTVRAGDMRDAIPASATAPEPCAASVELEPLTTPGELHAHTLRLGRLLVVLAQRRHALDPADPSAYRLLRLGGALGWERCPAANRRGRTELAPPSTKRRVALLALAADADWQGTLAASEALLASNPLWLDGHWTTRRALAALGERYAPALAVVEREVRALFARLPGLAALQFADGSPIGSQEARAWLAERPDAGPAPEVARPDAPDSGFEILCARSVAGDPAAAFELEETLRGAGSLRATFLKRQALAHSFEAAGAHERAMYLYLGLEQDIDAHGLERWEPELARGVLSALLRTLRVLEREGRASAELHRVRARLARLAPTRAV